MTPILQPCVGTPLETARADLLGRDVKVIEARFRGRCSLNEKRPERRCSRRSSLCISASASRASADDGPLGDFFHIAHALTRSRSCCVGLHAACRCRESRAPQRRERSVEKHHGSLSLSARLNARHQDASVVKEHQWRRSMSVSRRDVDLCAFFGRLFINCDRLLGAGCLSCPEDSETAAGEIPTRRAEEGRGREHQDTQVGHR